MLEQLKEEVCRLHLDLPRYNLVVWTGGNISARDPESGPLSYSWRIDNQTAGINSPNFTYRPTVKGERRVAVTVSDGELSVSYEWGVSIRPKAAPPAEDGGFPAATAAILAAVVAMAVVVAYLAMKKKK